MSIKFNFLSLIIDLYCCFFQELKKIQKDEMFLRRNLCSKTKVTNGEIILMCMLIGMRHSLTWEAMSDVINLFNKCFEEDVLDLSKYKLLNFFPENKEWYTYHIFCKVCKSYIGKRSDLKGNLE